jgi:hypothetical protein
MKNFDASQLSHFTGTERYYRISRRHLLTDGTKYLAEETECFWMIGVGVKWIVKDCGISADHC